MLKDMISRKCMQMLLIRCRKKCFTECEANVQLCKRKVGLLSVRFLTYLEQYTCLSLRAITVLYLHYPLKARQTSMSFVCTKVAETSQTNDLAERKKCVPLHNMNDIFL